MSTNVILLFPYSRIVCEARALKIDQNCIMTIDPTFLLSNRISPVSADQHFLSSPIVNWNKHIQLKLKTRVSQRSAWESVCPKLVIKLSYQAQSWIETNTFRRLNLKRGFPALCSESVCPKLSVHHWQRLEGREGGRGVKWDQHRFKHPNKVQR